MKEIDWSKAPDWAEWVGATESGFVWGGERGYVFFNTNLIHKWGDKRYSTDVPVLANRPTEWSGEGLPPVGTEIEWLDGEWVKVVVVGHYRGSVIALDPSSPRNVYIGKKPDYRPIRTPEQIAAEERERAINYMMSYLGGDGDEIRNTFGRLYDAGYRKQVQP